MSIYVMYSRSGESFPLFALDYRLSNTMPRSRVWPARLHSLQPPMMPGSLSHVRYVTAWWCQTNQQLSFPLKDIDDILPLEVFLSELLIALGDKTKTPLWL